MSLSDCERCWDTPCTCGYQYRNYSPEYFKQFAESIFNYRTKEETIAILKELLEKKEKEP